MLPIKNIVFKTCVGVSERKNFKSQKQWPGMNVIRHIKGFQSSNQDI